MKIIDRKEPWLLFLGDILILIFSLWLTLSVRSSSLADLSVFNEHLIPFSFLFAVWILIFFIAGLYEKHTNIFKSRLPVRLLNTQIFNSILAVVFFYFLPYFGITPKTILFIYLIISLILIFIWRNYGYIFLTSKQKESALIIGQGEEVESLMQEINNNQRYNFKFVYVSKPSEDVVKKIYDENISIVVIDMQDKEIEKDLPHFYNLLFSRVRFVDLNSLYEEVFDRVPVSLIGYNWFLENVFLSSSVSYTILKRLVDIVIAFILGLISLVFYPFIVLAIKAEDGGDIFISQNRIGKNNLPIKIIKFRTMSFNDNEVAGAGKNNKITKVGKFLRQSRLDELPQLWNVLKGDLSLIGPRPELPALTQIYEKEVPYYNVRHLIEPGLSGWAQLYHERHPHQGLNTEETKNKLSYDLYYIKNRSLALDLKIALKTIKALLSRTGK